MTEASSSTRNNNDGSSTIPISSIFYVLESFKATCVPVTITMILSALATNFIRTEESAKAREQVLTSSYSAIDNDDDKLGINLINGLVIIAAITLMTFLVVLLYKYKCMWCLKGYLILSISFLLLYFGGVMFHEAIMRYKLDITKLSFGLLLYNFAVVGIYSLFFGKGVPAYLPQGYLIVISVLLAWELSSFSEVLAWTLLVLLAMYDLWSVLTPCGPLNALVKLMGRDGAETIPALLYEAQLPPQARRQPNAQGSSQQSTTQPITTEQARNDQADSAQESSDADNPTTQSTRIVSHQMRTASDANSLQTNNTHNADQMDWNTDSSQNATSDQNMAISTDTPSSDNESAGSQSQYDGDQDEWKDGADASENPNEKHAEVMQSEDQIVVVSSSTRETVVSPSHNEFETIERPTGIIPLAIAKHYKLPLVDGRPTQGDFTCEELKAMVEVYFPRHGGRVEQLPNPPPIERSQSRFGLGRHSSEQEPQAIKYNIVDRNGAIRHTLFVGDDGKVYRFLNESEQQAQEEVNQGSIKLGLGDFIFYSVLVSKASMHSFTTFAACVAAILAGLLLTLLLLAIRGTALPALPFSIFLGVVFYLLTQLVLEPFVHSMHRTELYL